MNEIRISRQAAADEAEIWLHISRQNPQAADRVLAAIEQSYRTLASFPGLGQPCEELVAGLRASSVGRYVVYYRAIAEGIEVVRVVHGARREIALRPLRGLNPSAVGSVARPEAKAPIPRVMPVGRAPEGG